MKKYLVYNNIVHGAGIGHTLMCYNHAIQMSQEQHLKLVIPKCIMGHGLGGNFQFENFFVLDKYSDDQIKEIEEAYPNEIEYAHYDKINNGGRQNNMFLPTKDFFVGRYMSNIIEKQAIYPNHNKIGKINISVHIRRGDIVQTKVLAEGHYKGRILPDKWFRDALEFIIKKKGLDFRDVHVNIYSENQQNGLYYNENAEPSDLRRTFEFENCSFYLSTNMYEAVFNIVNSDIFIGGLNNGVPIFISLYRDGLSKESFVHENNAGYIRLNEFKHTQIIRKQDL